MIATARSVERGSTMTATISRRTEPGYRTGDGIDVYLFWNRSTGRVPVGVFGSRSGGRSELEVDARHALDAVDHLMPTPPIRLLRPRALTAHERRPVPQRRRTFDDYA